MIQWVTKTTKHRAEDIPSRLVYQRNKLEKKKKIMSAPLETDHVFLEIEIKRRGMVSSRRNHIKRKGGIMVKQTIMK